MVSGRATARSSALVEMTSPQSTPASTSGSRRSDTDMTDVSNNLPSVPSLREPASSSMSTDAQSEVPADKHDKPTTSHHRPKHIFSTLTASHRALLWPKIREQIISDDNSMEADLSTIAERGSPWFVHLDLCKHPHALSDDVDFSTAHMKSLTLSGSWTNVPEINFEKMHVLSSAYFATFNVLYPILDHKTFETEVLIPIQKHGFSNNSPNICLGLVVFALGEIAVSAQDGLPIKNGRPASNDSKSENDGVPPGLALYVEAGRRFGPFTATSSITIAQMLLLQATYLGACARYAEAWRIINMAALTCQMLVRCDMSGWSDPSTDALKRAYWGCLLQETYFHCDLDMPTSSLDELEGEVPMPTFSRSNAESGGYVEDATNYEYHFLAMIALRPILKNIQHYIHGFPDTNNDYPETRGEIPARLIEEFDRQLQGWRSVLPAFLRWDDSGDTPKTSPMWLSSIGSSSSDGSPASTSAGTSSTTLDQTRKWIQDLMVHQLRSRYHYTRFMLFRPSIYKVLQMSQLADADVEKLCGEALREACALPMTMAFFSNKKRLMPQLYVWTQVFMSMLLILAYTDQDENLKGIADVEVDRNNMQQSVDIMISWMAEMRHIDATAEWSWNIIRKMQYS
ncbi:hypothetical protein AAFC00_000669 [Neodothiora populina]